ncbi:MAG: ADP-ribosylglycohydrolase family protein, partial [Mesorhizobium sp.]
PRQRVADLKGIDMADVRALAADLVAARVARSGAQKTGSGKDAAA